MVIAANEFESLVLGLGDQQNAIQLWSASATNRSGKFGAAPTA